MERSEITTIQLGIPSKGPLYEGSIKLMEKAGFNFSKKARELTASCWIYTDNPDQLPLGKLQLGFLRPKDIVTRVAERDLDLGIVGGDTLAEYPEDVAWLSSLCYSKCRLAISVPESFSPSCEGLKSLDGLRVATSYPRVVRRFFKRAGLSVQLDLNTGSTEASVEMGWADVIADIIESGKTIEENYLREFWKIAPYQAELIGNPERLPLCTAYYLSPQRNLYSKVANRLIRANLALEIEQLKEATQEAS